MALRAQTPFIRLFPAKSLTSFQDFSNLWENPMKTIRMLVLGAVILGSWRVFGGDEEADGRRNYWEKVEGAGREREELEQWDRVRRVEEGLEGIEREGRLERDMGLIYGR